MNAKIVELLTKRIYIGTSSWKYPGWKGLVYHRKYKSEKEFQEKCLGEYAEHYAAVGVDHTYYAWPLPSTFEKYFAETNDSFRFCLKATEATTVFKYPNLKRYGKVAGKLNPEFLDPAAFADKFLLPLEPYKHRMGPILLEFSQFYPGMLSSGAEFTERLEHFLKRVTHISGFSYSVELRNAGWLKEPYFKMLVDNGVGHVFNSWTRMPELAEQLKLTESIKFPHMAARLLLKPGVKYEKAVEIFSPYDRVQDEHPDIRGATADLIRRALEQGVPAFVFVNNRCEGCAPKTIEAILALLD
jgi:uncharacterized protein YecE (DUF72 family)